MPKVSLKLKRLLRSHINGKIKPIQLVRHKNTESSQTVSVDPGFTLDSRCLGSLSR